MAQTYTSTVTKTFTRVELILIQIRKVLKYCGISDVKIRDIFDRGIREKWFEEISLYGIDNNEMCRAQIIMRIDWATNRFHIIEGREIVVADRRWTDDVAYEIDQILDLFCSYINDKCLSIRWTVTYSTGVNVEYVRKELGLKPADPIEWYGEAEEEYLTVHGLDELKIGCKIVCDE